LGAATIYETLVTEIFEQSHLFYDEEAEYDDYYEEEGLEEFVGESIEALGSYLADEQTDRVAREKSIAVLFALYRRDLHADDSHGFAERAAHQLVRYTHATGTADDRGVDSQTTGRQKGSDYWLPVLILPFALRHLLSVGVPGFYAWSTEDVVFTDTVSQFCVDTSILRR